jgi:hypothetical protein
MRQKRQRGHGGSGARSGRALPIGGLAGGESVFAWKEEKAEEKRKRLVGF